MLTVLSYSSIYINYFSNKENMNVEVNFVLGVVIFLRLLYIVADFIVRHEKSSWNKAKRRQFVVRIVSLTHAAISGLLTSYGFVVTLLVIHYSINLCAKLANLKHNSAFISLRHNSLYISDILSAIFKGYIALNPTCSLTASIIFIMIFSQITEYKLLF